MAGGGKAGEKWARSPQEVRDTTQRTVPSSDSRTCTGLRAPKPCTSLSVSALVNEPEQTTLTWDPQVTEAIIAGLEAPSQLPTETSRVGRPAA